MELQKLDKAEREREREKKRLQQQKELEEELERELEEQRKANMLIEERRLVELRRDQGRISQQQAIEKRIMQDIKKKNESRRSMISPKRRIEMERKLQAAEERAELEREKREKERREKKRMTQASTIHAPPALYAVGTNRRPGSCPSPIGADASPVRSARNHRSIGSDVTMSPRSDDGSDSYRRELRTPEVRRKGYESPVNSEETPFPHTDDADDECSPRGAHDVAFQSPLVGGVTESPYRPGPVGASPGGARGHFFRMRGGQSALFHNTHDNFFPTNEPASSSSTRPLSPTFKEFEREDVEQRNISEEVEQRKNRSKSGRPRPRYAEKKEKNPWKSRTRQSRRQIPMPGENLYGDVSWETLQELQVSMELKRPMTDSEDEDEDYHRGTFEPDWCSKAEEHMNKVNQRHWDMDTVFGNVHRRYIIPGMEALAETSNLSAMYPNDHRILTPTPVTFDGFAETIDITDRVKYQQENDLRMKSACIPLQGFSDSE